LAATFFSFLQ